KNSWKDYVSTINSNTECGKVWKKVNKIKGKFSPHPPPTLKENGTIITSPQEVANSFARCYQSINVKTKMAYPVEHRRAQILRRRQPFKKRGGHQDNSSLNSLLLQGIITVVSQWYYIVPCNTPESHYEQPWKQSLSQSTVERKSPSATSISPQILTCPKMKYTALYSNFLDRFYSSEISTQNTLFGTPSTRQTREAK
ncbi:MAG: hypothetical protein AAGM46_27810, partial [Cyanobacteria bacterium J06582_2]